MIAFIPNEEAMLQCGRIFALRVRDSILFQSESFVIYLYGPLGAGKTTWSRGFLRALGVTESIKSPTYTIVEPYPLSGFTVYHLDLYRLQDPEELEWIGIQDYFASPCIALIEWPDMGAGMLPLSDIQCVIEYEKEGRRITYSAQSPQGSSILVRLSHEQ